MKFTIKSVSETGPRLGILNDIEGKPDVEMETPVVLLYTQGGHIPHVTHEVFKLVSNGPQILQIPLVSMHNYKETFEYYEGRISEFVGSKDSLTCLTLQDPGNLTKQGHHVKEKVPIWTKNGKVLYDSKMYMDLVEGFKPDMYYLLSDGDTNKSSPQKRVLKAVENTLLFNKQCLERHRSSEILKTTFVMAPIAGGYCLRSRQKCIEEVLKNALDVQGFLLDGLHNNGPEVEFLPIEEVKPIVEFIIEKLPPEKLRSVQGCWSPVNILRLVQLGVDLFDTSYCRILTERSAAMTFPIDDAEEFENYEINLRHSKYTDDFQPLMFSCHCLTCCNYSRGYIHHLLTVQELLGPVLIMIHNVYHYLRFFKKIRKCIRDNNLNEFENKIAEQYKNHQEKVLSSNIENNGTRERDVLGRNSLGDTE